MIALTTDSGELLRVFSAESAFEAGFHKTLGWVSALSAKHREQNRTRALHRELDSHWTARFRIVPQGARFKVEPLEACSVSAENDGWRLETAMGVQHLRLTGAPVPTDYPSIDSERSKGWIWLGALVVAGLLTLPLWTGTQTQTEKDVETEVIPEAPITVKTVRIPVPAALIRGNVNRSAGSIGNDATAVGVGPKKNLGFLGVLGKKDLREALGGVPIEAAQVSPGAGAGGNAGSGGELLSGIGKGLKQTTVGNSQTSGLGGIGVGGAGGGKGGYGNSLVGSGGSGTGIGGIGTGTGLASAVALSTDLVLEGGLDRAVIQATIAKYLPEIRACYEEGLRAKAGLSGQVTTQFEIKGNGQMQSVNVARSSLGSPSVESCMVTSMRSWIFPAPRGGVNVKVTYPFVLNPVKS